MRSSIALLVGLALLAGLAPTAAAAPTARLQLNGPASVTIDASPTVLTLDLVLTLKEFHCTRPEAFAVTLRMSADGVDASLAPATASFLIPTGSYAFTAYEANATVNVTITSTTSGTLVVNATFESDGGDCIAPGGFPVATATWTATVAGTEPPTPTPTPPSETVEPTPDESTPPEPTPGEEPATNSSSETPTTPPTTGRVDRLPEGGGYIGDYKPQESGKDAPGATAALAAGAVALAALLLRKR